jgi:hypothetical protein
MGTNTLSTRATKQIVQAVDVNQYFTALCDDFVPRVTGTGLPLTNWGSIGNATYKWATGFFHGNVDAGSFTINGVPVGTSTSSYWTADGSNNLSYNLGNISTNKIITAGTFTGGNMTGNWAMNSGNVSGMGTLGCGAITSSGNISISNAGTATNISVEGTGVNGGIGFKAKNDAVQYSMLATNLGGGLDGWVLRNETTGFNQIKMNSGAPDSTLVFDATGKATFAGKIETTSTASDSIKTAGGVSVAGDIIQNSRNKQRTIYKTGIADNTKTNIFKISGFANATGGVVKLIYSGTPSVGSGTGAGIGGELLFSYTISNNGTLYISTVDVISEESTTYGGRAQTATWVADNVSNEIVVSVTLDDSGDALQRLICEVKALDINDAVIITNL